MRSEALERLARIAAMALVVLLAMTALAAARPGGGQSYSGGGGHSSGGSSSGGDGAAIFELVFHLLRLCIYYPAIGLPILAIVIAFVCYQAYKKHKDRDWDSGPPVPLAAGNATRLEAIRAIDPDFSSVLFEDFCFRLYATAQRARSATAAMDALAPYLSETARAALLARAPTGQPVEHVVVGAMRPFRVELPAPPDGDGDEPAAPAYVRVGLELETNVTVGAAGAQRTFYFVERWLLRRAASARTRPPAAVNRFPCPSCGADFQSSDGARCAYCEQIVANGRFDWQVEEIVVRHSAEKAPTVAGDVPERGTDLPTYTQDDFPGRWATFQQEDPAITEAAILARVQLIHGELNRGWGENDLTPVRGLVSDGLYDSLRYWVEAYRAQGLRNAVDNSRITGWVLAKLARDRHYDALTVRIWSTGCDYTSRLADGVVIAGSRSRERRYSEYWTLMRSSARRGPALGARQCPGCGAPLQITMAGTCEFCSAHLTAGEFDWVLSKIEQDDSYRG